MAGLSPKQVDKLSRETEKLKVLQDELYAAQEKGDKAAEKRAAKLLVLANGRVDGIAHANKESDKYYKGLKDQLDLSTGITKATQSRATILAEANVMAKLNATTMKKGGKDVEKTSRQLNIQQEAAKGLLGLKQGILDVTDEEALAGADLAALQSSIVDIKKKSVNADAASKKAINQVLGDMDAQVDVLQEQQDYLQAENSLRDATIGKFTSMGTKMKGMIKSAKMFAKVLLANPIFLLAAVVIGILALMKKFISDSFALRDGLGASVGQAAMLNKQLQGARIEAMVMGYDVNQIASDLEESFGSLSSITSENVKSLGRMEKTLGIATKDSAVLVKSFMDLSGGSFDAGVNMVKLTSELAVANNVAPGAVMKDIAENTEMFAEFGADGGKNIAKAAVQAKKLGVNLSTTAKIANSLLDFESSIEKEMEASMMIGKQLNYNKARELALSGDVAGATADVVKQLGGQAELSKLNVLQRRALADSIGVSVEEMNKLASGKVSLAPPKSTPQERMNELMEQLIASLDKFSSFVTDMGTGLVDYYKKIFQAAFGESGLGAALGNLGSSIMKQVGEIFGGEGTFATKLGQALATTLVALVKSLPEIFLKLHVGIRLGLTSIFVFLTDMILGLGEGILNTIGGFFGWENMGTVVADIFRDFRDGMVSIFKSMMQGVIDLIYSIPMVGKFLGEKPSLSGTVQAQGNVSTTPGTTGDSAMGGMVSKEFGDLDAKQQQLVQEAMAQGTLEAFLKAKAESGETDKRSIEMQELAAIMMEVAKNTGKSVDEIANMTRE